MQTKELHRTTSYATRVERSHDRPSKPVCSFKQRKRQAADRGTTPALLKELQKVAGTIDHFVRPTHGRPEDEGGILPIRTDASRKIVFRFVDAVISFDALRT